MKKFIMIIFMAFILVSCKEKEVEVVMPYEILGNLSPKEYAEQSDFIDCVVGKNSTVILKMKESRYDRLDSEMNRLLTEKLFDINADYDTIIDISSNTDFSTFYVTLNIDDLTEDEKDLDNAFSLYYRIYCGLKNIKPTSCKVEWRKKDGSIIDIHTLHFENF